MNYDWWTGADDDYWSARQDAIYDEMSDERAKARAAIAEEDGRDPDDISDDEADELLSAWAATGETEASLMPGRV